MGGGDDQKVQALNAEGVAYLNAGDYLSAERCFLRALSAAPNSIEGRAFLGLTLLHQGHFELGWMLYESRRLFPGIVTADLGIEIPAWRGEKVAGKRIVVVGEQGLGDQIMFARYLSVLEARGAQVSYCCAEAVAPLFDCSVPLRRSAIRALKPDYRTVVCSLPHLLGPSEIPPPARIATPIRSGGGIGVMADVSQSFPQHEHKRPSDDARGRLLALGRNLSPEATGATDFGQTAEIVADLDLVISTDTSVAHLAASMGKPTWVLAVPFASDWCWPRGLRTTPWYETARVYWQTDGWDALLDEVERDLAAFRTGVVLDEARS